MALHLIKLSVGSESISDLVEWQTQRWKKLQASGATPELMHITRHMPKRREELLKAGSIYWVINGFVCARQKLLELRPITHDGTAHCGIIYEKRLVRVKPRPHRPFQGWRYLQGKDAPKDMGKAESDAPDSLLRELAESGLL